MKQATIAGIFACAAALAFANESSELTKMGLIVNANPAPAGTITGPVTGRVVFEGELPEAKELLIDAEAAKGCVHEGSVDKTDRGLLVDKDMGIANVVVTVEVKDAELEVPEKSIKLDQKACRFEPHVMAVPVGATLEFLNSDTVSHNVHTYPKKNDPINEIIEPGGTKTQVLEKTDQIEIKCDIHPWMNSHLFVTDTPYMAITDATGHFSVDGLPAGEYEVEVWHERLGKADGKVTIGEDGSSEAMEIKLGAAKKRGGRRRR